LFCFAFESLGEFKDHGAQGDLDAVFARGRRRGRTGRRGGGVIGAGAGYC
jgi:hypothetical protein